RAVLCCQSRQGPNRAEIVVSELVCLHCAHPLTDAEMEAGWCDSCGKQLPTHLVSAAAARRRTATLPGGPRGKTKGRRSNPLALLVIVAFVLVGAFGCGIIYMRVSKEPNDLGTAAQGGAAGLILGGILGVLVSRALGLLGKRTDED